MKHLKKFNESIKRKDIKEVIDEILNFILIHRNINGYIENCVLH